MKIENNLLAYKLRKALNAAIKAKNDLLDNHNKELTEDQKKKIERINKEITELQIYIESIS